MPPKGRTPSNPPRRRPKVAGHNQPTRRPGPDPTADADATQDPWADTPTGTPADATTAPEQPTVATADPGRRAEAAPDQRVEAATEQWADDPTADAVRDEPTPPPAPEPEVTRRPAVATAPPPRRPSPVRREPAPNPFATPSYSTPNTAKAANAAKAGTAPDTSPASRDEGTDDRGRAGVPLLVVLLLVAVVAGAGAAVLRGQAARASTGSADNLAIVDTTATTEVVGQISKAIEIVLSYDHTKLDENERAGREVITDKYAEEFGTTFADVRKTAPEQKLVLTTTVLLAGVTSLGPDRAEVIATMDLAAMRDTTQYNSPGRVKVVATKVDGRWKIAEMTLL